MILTRHRLRERLRRLGEWVWLRYRMFRQPVVEIAGVRLPVGQHLSRKATRALYQGSYEKDEQRIIAARLSPDDIVIEMGAGLGFISSLCAKRIGSERVFAYEANPELRRHILRTYALNDVRPTIEICVLGSSGGTRTFYVEKNFFSSSTVRRSARARAIQVPVKSCNEEIGRIRPSFLIVDIEGGEYELLRNIDFQTVRKIAIELHERVIGPAGVAFVRSRLADAGFHVLPDLSTEEHLYLQRE